MAVRATNYADLSIQKTLVPRYKQATANIPSGAAAADYQGLFYINTTPGSVQVVSVTERHATAGTDAGAVTLMVKRVPAGTAKASGTDVLASGFNLKATADGIQTGTLNATQSNYILTPGDALGLVLTGTPTSVAGVTVSVLLKRI